MAPGQHCAVAGSCVCRQQQSVRNRGYNPTQHEQYSNSQKPLVRASPPHMTFGVSSFGFFPENTARQPFSKSTKHPSRSQYTFGASQYTFGASVGVDFTGLAEAALPEPLTKGVAHGLSAIVNRRNEVALAQRCIRVRMFWRCAKDVPSD